MAKHPQKSKSSASPSKSAEPSGDQKLDRLFSGPASIQPTQRLWGSGLLFDLVFVRPWILVGSFWLILMLTIAIAFGGLTNPGKQASQVTAESEVVSADGVVMPDAAATSRLTPQAGTLRRAADPAATLVGTTEQPVPIWPLWVMVLACAGGCFVMSRQGVAAPRLQQSRGRRRSGGTTPGTPEKSVTAKVKAAKAGRRSTQAAQSKMSQVKPEKSRRRPVNRRLKPQYPSAQVMTVESTNRSIHQVTPTQSQSLSPAPVASKPVSFAMKPVTVSVVPTSDSHPLDWQGNSLAHSLDVRTKRSLNSLL